ncbi:MAG: peptidoglycan-binding domain-containing protein [Ilumatobacteraceae bacterium]
MSTDPDRELRQLARAMVADDDPPTIPPWPLDADVEPRGSGRMAGRRLLVVAATVILIVAAVGGLVALGVVDDAAPADAPATSAPATTVAPTVTTPPTTIPSATLVAPPSPSTSTATATATPSTPSDTSGAAPTSPSSPTPCEGPPGPDIAYPLQLCDGGLAVAVLKQELAAKGYLPPSTANLALFDDQVDAAVRAFQTDHGLVVDGLVGPITWAAITADYQRRVGDPNGDGHLDPAEVGIIGDANEG